MSWLDALPWTLLATQALAQAPAAPPARADAVAVSHNCGLGEEGGELWGLGPDYKARFLVDGMEFTPALGERAPRNLPLTLRFLGAGRGEAATTTPAARPRREWSGRTVRYHHGACDEVLAVGVDAVKQSFVFRELPAGRGDLVVRLAVDTELAPDRVAVEATTLAFKREGVGGVTIGAVVGIDAAGRRAAGSMRYADGVLALRLPATFVDSAALPLVLDPPVGATISFPGGNDEELGDVAYLGPDNHLAVWGRRFSSNDVDIRGQRVDTSGALVGGTLSIRSSSLLLSDSPTVCGISMRGAFAVAWRESGGRTPSQVMGCTVGHDTGAVSAAITVASSTTDDLAGPDLAGDLEQLGDEAIVVFANSTQGSIEAARIVLSQRGVFATGRTVISPVGSRTAPAISASGGPDGRFLIVWQGAPSFSTTWIEGAVVDRRLTVLDRPALVSTAAPYESRPDAAGDGLHWQVVYERRTGITAPADIHGLWVTFDPRTGSAYTAPEVLLAGGSDVQVEPCVTFAGAMTLVGYADDLAAGSYGAYVRSLDWFSCLPCEGPYTLDATSGRAVTTVRAAWSRNAGEALLLWESRDANNAGILRARRYAPDLGAGGGVGNTGCGPDVRVYATCVRSPHPDFAMRLEHAEPAAPAVLLFSFSSNFGGNFDCGGCRLLDPFRSFVLPMGATDAHGNLAVSVPIPAVSPLLVTFQFGYVPSQGPAGCAALGASFSRVGLITIP